MYVFFPTTLIKSVSRNNIYNMPEPIRTHGTSVNAMVAYPIANGIARRSCGWITANAITFANMGVSAAILYFVYSAPCDARIIVVLCAVRAFLDILDGAVARTCSEVSEWGQALDKGGDVVFATGLIGLFIFNTCRCGSYRAPHFWPVALLVAVLLSFGVLEAVNTAGVWQDNDLIFKPIVYTCAAFCSYRHSARTRLKTGWAGWAGWAGWPPPARAVVFFFVAFPVRGRTHSTTLFRD